MEESEKEKIRKSNEVTEAVYRHSEEKLFTTQESIPVPRAPYPWEKSYIGEHVRITKEFFRCRGSHANPVLQVGSTEVRDCGGVDKHGLPYVDGQEFVYPVLIEILNYLQEVTKLPVVITSGYRCPEHNRYVDTSKTNATSKHQIGAEVDFYIESMEDDLLSVVKHIMQFYHDHDRNEPGYHQFMKCRRNPRGLNHPGWYNKEIVISIQEKEEGRNFDNRHPYPYITIQVRYDREKEEYVEYSWKKANSSYIRY